MRLRRVRLVDFKRFDDLTLDLGDPPPKIVALVGPNGCGKSAVFDAFQQEFLKVKGADGWNPGPDFYRKLSPSPPPSLPRRGEPKVVLSWSNSMYSIGAKSFHFRSPYRFSPSLAVTAIDRQPSLLEDGRRPGGSIALDRQFEANYRRLLEQIYARFEIDDMKRSAALDQLVGPLNAALDRVLGLKLARLGIVSAGEGQPFFAKDDVSELPYALLSAGEKEVLDLLMDLSIRREVHDDTVYCVDEPELHLHTRAQRALLREIAGLVGEQSQLWIATHSAGFLRALETDLASESVVLDFSREGLFQGSHTLTPMKRTRENWQRLLATALDDLATLVAPGRIVYCEGRADADGDGRERGLDARAYNAIFGASHPDTFFVSAGGCHEAPAHRAVALDVLRKAFLDVKVLLLRDRDQLDDQARAAFLAESSTHRMLVRREIENYLCDFELLAAYAAKIGSPVPRETYDALVSDIQQQDLKRDGVVAKLRALVPGGAKSNDQFLMGLAECSPADSAAMRELRACVFGE